MKAYLMYRGQDFNLEAPLPPNAPDLIQDLELNTLLNAMAHDDKFLFDVAKKTVLSTLTDPEEISFRQQILMDCLEHPSVAREIYAIALEAIQGEKLAWRFSLRSPDSVLSSSIRLLEIFFPILIKLRHTADTHASEFHSEGFVRFFEMIKQELNDEYLSVIQDHVAQLRFPNGALISAQLGKGNKGNNYTLRKPFEKKQSWTERLLHRDKPLYFEIADRDESGIRAIEELRERGINKVANALSQSADHILNFFTKLREEMGFYMTCINLKEQLERKGEPTCIPEALAADKSALSAKGLYDICLSLRLESRVVGNELAADNKELVFITGANQGGKSTFLRSIGLAYLMMQCGMFVAAERFSANVSDGIFTHFKREEDATMKSGKLDEELSRMSEIADYITTNCIMLCNESFASTNEREGSEIARQITYAMLNSGIKVLFVTHLFELARIFYERKLDIALFLRAERKPDGQRTFRIVEGEPLPTSYGVDLYKQIFGS